MANVHDVYITKEASRELDLNPSYLIKLTKKMVDEGILTEADFRDAGNRSYLFSKHALEVIGNRNKEANEKT